MLPPVCFPPAAAVVLRSPQSTARIFSWRKPTSLALPTKSYMGFPGGSAGKESACDAGDLNSIPGSGRSPGEGNGYPLQYSCQRIPWTEGPGGLQSMGWQRIGNDWTTIHGILEKPYEIRPLLMPQAFLPPFPRMLCLPCFFCCVFKWAEFSPTSELSYKIFPLLGAWCPLSFPA